MEIDPKILCGVSALVVVVCLYKLYVSENFKVQKFQTKQVGSERVLVKDNLKPKQKITIPVAKQRPAGYQSKTRAKYSAEEFGYGYDF